jgi:hypothetical protein
LILDLAVEIVPIERNAAVGIERENHRVIRTMQQRARRGDVSVLGSH